MRSSEAEPIKLNLTGGNNERIRSHKKQEKRKGIYG